MFSSLGYADGSQELTSFYRLTPNFWRVQSSANSLTGMEVMSCLTSTGRGRGCSSERFCRELAVIVRSLPLSLEDRTGWSQLWVPKGAAAVALSWEGVGFSMIMTK